jgi:hypothetical protein
MSVRAILPLVTVVATFAAVPASAVEPIHSLGRHYGHGWSDGYHSRAACPPKRSILHSPPPAAQSTPWWMIPAGGAEPLPQPATKEPSTSRTSPASGPSLFRQPGAGAPTGQTLMR